MSNETIKDLWLGNICPQETLELNSEEACEAARSVIESEKALLETLNDEQKMLYAEFDAACAKHTSICDQEIFAAGFKLAVNLIFESLTDRNNAS